MNPEQLVVLCAFKGYLRSISNTYPPLTLARSLVVPDAIRCITPPGTPSPPPQFLMMNQTLTVLEDRIRETPDMTETLVPPSAEVFVHEDLAAVWTGSQKSIGGSANLLGVHAFSLLKEPKVGWKIAGVATTARTPDQPLLPIANDTESGEGLAAMKAIRKFDTAFNSADWASFEGALHPDMGVTVSKDTWPPVTFRRSSFVDLTKQSHDGLPEGSTTAQIFYDEQVRVHGNVGFVWTMFNTTVNGEVVSKGAHMLRLGKVNEQWTVVGITTTSRSVSDGP